MSNSIPHTSVYKLEIAFRDVVSRFLKGAGKPALYHELALINALRRFFPRVHITVIWCYSVAEQVREMRAVACRDLAPPYILDDETVKEIIIGIEEVEMEKYPANTCTILKSHLSKLNGGLIIIQSKNKQLQERSESHNVKDLLYIVFNGPLSDPMFERVGWLQMYMRGLQELYDAVRALKSAQFVSGLNIQIQRIVSVRPVAHDDHEGVQRAKDALFEAVRLVHEISFQDYLISSKNLAQLLIELAHWGSQLAIQGHILTQKVDRENLSDLFECLENAIEELDPTGQVLRRYSKDIYDLRRFALNVARKRRLEQANPVLEILQKWRILLEDVPKKSNTQKERSWRCQAARTLKPVLTFLRRWWMHSFSSAGGVSARRVAMWLYLWFACEALRDMEPYINPPKGGPRFSDLEKQEFYASLALIIRDSIRYFAIQKTSEFSESMPFFQALARLVIHHAHGVVGLPLRHNLGSFLRYHISEPRHSDDIRFAEGHLRHALQVYISGHFILSLKIPSGEERLTMTQVLQSGDGQEPVPEKCNELLQAFSLAALYHDVGMPLVPAIFERQKRLTKLNRDLESELVKLDQRLYEIMKGSFTDILTKASDELSHLVIRDDNVKLKAWIKSCQENGRPDHSLLGAWYLYGICKDNKNSDMIISATRAILLHGINVQQIESIRDPTASLLVLCDEIFDWTPSIRDLRIGRLPSLTSIEESEDEHPLSSGSRTIRLTIPELQINIEGDRLICLLEQPTSLSGEFAPGWPNFELQLKSPDRLEIPVYRVWIASALNLGRIKPSSRGWMPSFTLKSRLPRRLEALKTTTREVLERVLETDLQYRNELGSWLADKGRYRREGKKGEIEVVRINKIENFAPERIEEWFIELDEAFDNVLNQMQSIVTKAS